MDKSKNLLKATGMVSLVVAFFLMCIARMWYTMFIIFIFALFTVLLRKRNVYCSHFCPLGTLQDATGEKKGRAKAVLGIALYRFLFILGFWALTIYSTFMFYNNSQILWVYMLRIMVTVMFIAIVTQEMLGKRFFCVHLCPLRIPILTPLGKIRKKTLGNRAAKLR